MIAFRHSLARLDEWSIQWMPEGRFKEAVRAVQRSIYWVTGIPLMVTGIAVATICLI